MKNLNLILLCVMLLGSNCLYAQSRTITGTITNKSEDALPGVNLLIEDTNQGTITDVNGSFQLQIPNNVENPKFLVTYIGHKSQKISVANRTVINISMEEITETLSEIVITAFGIGKAKATLGYSTQTLKGDDIIKAREPNPINGMTGKIAGLTVGPSAEMLASPQILLRGNSDILFVVDGVPINTDTWNISPDDIESYTVLKGPNAAALYGFRGQNGAILITTKRGSGKDRGFSLNINSSTQVQNGWISRPHTQSEYGLGNTFRYAYGNDPFDQDGSFRRASIWGPRFEGQLVPQYDSPVDPETGIRQGTPWFAKGPKNYENFMQTGVLTSNNVSLGFNDDKADFRLSYTNSLQRGVFPNTSLNINNLNMSAGYNFTKKLKLEGNINVSLQNSPNVPEVHYGPNSYTYSFGVYGGAHYDLLDLKDYWASPGIEGIQQRNREYGRTNNPYFMAYEWLRGHSKTDTYGYLALSYKATDHLKFQIRSNATNWDAMRTEKLPYSAEHYSVPDRAGNYSEDRRSLLEHKTDLLMTYDRSFGDFNLNILGGANARYFHYNSSILSTNNLIVPGVYAFSNSENPLVGQSFRSNMMVLAAYTSVDLGYKNFVTLNLTGHWDKLSTLPPGDQAYFYPSTSLSTVVSDFISMPSFISFLKLRGSFAQVQGGLVRPTIGSAFTAMGGTPAWHNNVWFTTYDGPTYLNENTYSTSLPYGNQPGASFTSTLANRSLQPFTVTSYETGIDMFFLKDRLGLDITYFSTINGPQIFTRGMAPSTGFSQTNVNDVVTTKNGLEVSLTGVPIVNNNFKWEVLVNYASFVERYTEINDPSGSIISNGGVQRVGDRVDRLFTTDVLRTPEGQIIHDIGGLPLRGPSGIRGNYFVGNGNSDFVWAINNRFTYKNWNFSFQVDGRVGGVIYNDLWRSAARGGADITTAGDTPYGRARLQEWESFRDNGATTPHYIGGGVVLTAGVPVYDDEGAITNFDELTFRQNDVPATVQDYTIALSGFTGEWVHSKSFAKLREIIIGYKLPTPFVDKIGASSATVSLVGRNLLYKAARTDIDIDQYPGPSLLPYNDEGQPRLQSPSLRNYGINLNITF